MNIKQTVQELHWKADQLIKQAERYRKIAADLEEIENELPVETNIFNAPVPRPSKKYKLPEAVRHRMSKAQKARWENFRQNRKKEFHR